ncbi:MAG: hypothetical protein OEZ02_14685, partial [Anaerolineae bacterium]|nr:hypothetical protein [Anaerolineae bacterium]
MHPLACELREIWCKYLHLRARAEALLLGLPLTTTITYTYDELYRLTDATYSSYDTDKTYSYTYDAVGNALSYSTNVNNLVTTTNYTYNAANQLMTAQVNNNPTVWNYTHDGRGNLTEVTPNGTPGIGAQRYTYNTAGYLSQVENYNGSAYELRAEMSYNGLGDRISMTGWESGLSLTTNYTLDLTRYAQPLSATAAGNSTFYLYGRDAAAEKTDAWAYYLKDGTTTTRQMTGPAAEVLVVRGFTPWGEITYQNGIDDLAWGYFGGLMDAATGLIYMGAGQYYDPSTGRFLSPVNNFDPENPGNPYLPSSGDPLGAMLGPVALLLLLSGRRKKKGKVDKLLLLLLMSMAVVMGVVACGEGPAPTPPPPSS